MTGEQLCWVWTVGLIVAGLVICSGFKHFGKVRENAACDCDHSGEHE